MKKVSFLLASILCAVQAFSQSFTAFSPDPSGFPSVSAAFYAVGADGQPIQGLTASNFTVTEDGTPRTVTGDRKSVV